MKVFVTKVNSSYSLTLAVRASVWSVVVVLFPWEGRLVLPTFYYYFVNIILCVRVCVLTTAFLIIDLCNCLFFFAFNCIFMLL